MIFDKAISWSAMAETKRVYVESDSRAKFVMVHDALPFSRGGIKRGAKFDSEEFLHMVRNESLTAGTILHSLEHGADFMVIYPVPMRYEGNTMNKVPDVDKLIRIYQIIVAG